MTKERKRYYLCTSHSRKVSRVGVNSSDSSAAGTGGKCVGLCWYGGTCWDVMIR